MPTVLRYASRASGLAALSLCGALLFACAQRPARTPAAPQASGEQPPVEVITSTDACAGQMHQISGALLLYYARHGQLPKQLEELTESAAEPIHSFQCPVSNRRYVYNPGGIYAAEREEYIILFDPAASHSGLRWAITIDEPVPGQPLVAKVIALPESFFLLHRTE